MQGFPTHVYRNSHLNGSGDGGFGVSSIFTSLCVTDVDEYGLASTEFAQDNLADAVTIAHNAHTHMPQLMPLDAIEAGGEVHYGFSGNFAWSNDSRWREIFPTPMPIYDRRVDVELEKIARRYKPRNGLYNNDIYPVWIYGQMHVTRIADGIQVFNNPDQSNEKLNRLSIDPQDALARINDKTMKLIDRDQEIVPVVNPVEYYRG